MEECSPYHLKINEGIFPAIKKDSLTCTCLVRHSYIPNPTCVQNQQQWNTKSTSRSLKGRGGQGSQGQEEGRCRQPLCQDSPFYLQPQACSPLARGLGTGWGDPGAALGCSGVGFFFFFGLTTWHEGSWFPDQGSNPHPLQWHRGVLTAGLPGKSLLRCWFLMGRLVLHKSLWATGHRSNNFIIA